MDIIKWKDNIKCGKYGNEYFMLNSKIEFNEIDYFMPDKNWVCPVCKTKLNDLFLKLRELKIQRHYPIKEIYMVDRHHYGKSPNDKEYYKADTIWICRRCNGREAALRKKLGFKLAMSVEQMSQYKSFFPKYINR